MPLSGSGVRKIIHVDMDAFYASVEQRDRPELRGKPIVVGGSPDGRGVVASCSYEARKFGVRSAMSCRKALSICPQVIFVRCDFSKYKQVSRQIRTIFQSVTDLVEPLSLDEAYLDVTTNKWNEPLATPLAIHIRERIRNELGLTASAGVGPNKFIAKVASDFKKPDGLCVVPPEKAKAFVAKLPVEKLWGVGPATAKKLHDRGLKTALDIRNTKRENLIRWFSGFGAFLHDLSNAEDSRPVCPNREPKSRGAETTFDSDIVELSTLTEKLRDLSYEVARSLEKLNRPAATITVKIRYYDFSTITRSQTLSGATKDASQIFQTAKQLLTKSEAGKKPIRLLGISCGNLVSPKEENQLALF